MGKGERRGEKEQSGQARRGVQNGRVGTSERGEEGILTVPPPCGHFLRRL